MSESTPAILDLDLNAHDIQAISNSDGVVAFFARLGYNTNVRTIQTPAALEINAESTKKAIRRIELIAEQEGLLRVYLFELSSVTGRAHSRTGTRVSTTGR